MVGWELVQGLVVGVGFGVLDTLLQPVGGGAKGTFRFDSELADAVDTAHKDVASELFAFGRVHIFGRLGELSRVPLKSDLFDAALDGGGVSQRGE